MNLAHTLVALHQHAAAVQASRGGRGGREKGGERRGDALSHLLPPPRSSTRACAAASARLQPRGPQATSPSSAGGPLALGETWRACCATRPVRTPRRAPSPPPSPSSPRPLQRTLRTARTASTSPTRRSGGGSIAGEMSVLRAPLHPLAYARAGRRGLPRAAARRLSADPRAGGDETKGFCSSSSSVSTALLPMPLLRARSRRRRSSCGRHWPASTGCARCT